MGVIVLFDSKQRKFLHLVARRKKGKRKKEEEEKRKRQSMGK
jgi:hypothetical protein